ncbi:nuclear pore glycoprotein p62 [Drosophila grimshawi]|uniref:GH19964 n=1 Tax=Drosophila grimshawi TaxID=7222 RepID=B4J8E9_DROGR|nr:nuclear pore glycoprotein p62 [Drosophila grimshawi]EDW02308.1 GH19964 [Drosophila grimshawi]
MAFQLPTTTTAASATGFSFGLNTAPATANPGAAVPAKPTFSFAAPAAAAAPTLGGGDADSVKTAPPPFTGFGSPAAASAATAPLTGLGTGLGGTASNFAVAATSAPAHTPQMNFALPVGGFMSQPVTTATTAVVASSAAAGAAPAPTANPLIGGISMAAKSTSSVAPVSAAVAPLVSSAAAAPVGGGTFANLSTATKTTDSAAVLNASQLTYNQLEEHINKWTLEFEEQEKVFTEQATQINAWDKLLIGNNQKIIELNDAVQKVKNDQQVLDQELEFIATQHKELEESLLPLEKEFTNLPRVDQERSQTYLMVENLDTQLKQMSEDLKEVIDNLNEANKGQDSTDPIIQIGKILNAHMNSLQWVESQSKDICKKLDDIAKIHETQKRDIFRAPY